VGSATITHPEKVLFPDDGITKGELAAYYEAIAPVMLPHVANRPVTMERYPSGIASKGFWQKDVSKGFPDWLERVEVPKKDGTVHHPVVTDVRSLLWTVNQNTITHHVWSSRVPDLKHPDVCVFDLDPSTDDVASVRAAAIGLRDLLEKLTLPSWIKTTGSKGFHIVVPLDGKATMGEAARFADARSLLWTVNQNTITHHVWNRRTPNLQHPDICVFDLDPSIDDAAAVRAAALALRTLLDELGLPSAVKTSGSKGFHIVVPLDATVRTGAVARFADAIGTLMVARHPDTLTQEFSKADRGGRILVDTGRNGYSATFAAPYTVRARPGAPVSAPCTWTEIERGEVAPRSFTVRTMPGRIAEVGDLWAGMAADAGRLTAETLDRLEALSTAASAQPPAASR